MSKRKPYDDAVPLTNKKDGEITISPTQRDRNDTSLSPVASNARSFIDLRSQRRRTSSSPVDLLASEEVGETVLLSTKSELLACGSRINIHESEASSSDEELINLDQRVYTRLQKNAVTRNEEAAKTIELQAYEIKVLKATLRQYRKKVFKIERLSQAATARDDVLFARANARIEDEEEYASESIKSESDKEEK